MKFIKYFLTLVCSLSLSLWLECSAKIVFDSWALGCDQTKVREIDFFRTKYGTFISTLQNIIGKKFVVKQLGIDNYWQYFSAAKEKLCSSIALSIGVYTNRIEIIPAHYEFPGKRIAHAPATLHTFVPGILMEFLPKEWAFIAGSIRQFRDERMPQEQWGLTREVIRNMSVHPGLPSIVALDTFIANSDRSRKNYLYDIKNDRFYAIDFGSTFNKNLAWYACNCIEFLLRNEEVSITEAEICGLILYNNTLKKLVRLYTPQTLYNSLVGFCEEGGMPLKLLLRKEEKNNNVLKLLSLSHDEKGTTFRLIPALLGNKSIHKNVWELKIVEELKVYKKKMQTNYDHCKKLSSLLDKLIARYTREKHP